MAAASPAGSARGSGPTRQWAPSTSQIVVQHHRLHRLYRRLTLCRCFLGCSGRTRDERSGGDYIATLTDGDVIAIDVRDLAKNSEAYKQQPIQLRGVVTRIEKVHVGTYMLLSVKTRDGAQQWSVWVQYGGTLPGIVKQATVIVFGAGDGTDGGRNAWAGNDKHLVVRADRVVPQS